MCEIAVSSNIVIGTCPGQSREFERGMALNAAACIFRHHLHRYHHRFIVGCEQIGFVSFSVQRLGGTRVNLQAPEGQAQTWR